MQPYPPCRDSATCCCPKVRGPRSKPAAFAWSLRLLFAAGLGLAGHAAAQDSQSARETDAASASQSVNCSPIVPHEEQLNELMEIRRRVGGVSERLAGLISAEEARALFADGLKKAAGVNRPAESSLREQLTLSPKFAPVSERRGTEPGRRDGTFGLPDGELGDPAPASSGSPQGPNTTAWRREETERIARRLERLSTQLERLEQRGIAAELRRQARSLRGAAAGLADRPQ